MLLFGYTRQLRTTQYDLLMPPRNERLKAETVPSDENQRRSPRGFWRTGLLLTTSAALGGIAVALWNRRSLERIRQKAPRP